MFKNYFEKGFKTSTEGEIIYAPFGYRGKSYIIPDQEQKLKIINWYKRLMVSTIIFVMYFPMINLLVFDSLYIERYLKSDLQLGSHILFSILFLICFNQIFKKRLSRFESIARAQKISFREVAQKSAQSMSYARFIAIEISLLFILAMSANASFLFPKDPHIGNRPTLVMQIFMISLFVICLIVFVWFLYLLMIKVRTHFKDKA